MSREIRRVPIDFDWPLKQVWEGYQSPAELHEDKCPDCERGYSPYGQYLADLWYGHEPFDPHSTGSSPLTVGTPEVWAFAERNVTGSPKFYGNDPGAIEREAQRLAYLFNAAWCHHLSPADVAALVDGGRLMDFTHTWSRETRWQKKDPAYTPTAAEVNQWSLVGMGHDAINAMICIEARCEREGFATTCDTCKGHGSVERYPGQREAAEAWEPTEPPIGEGWQVWETTSEGSPISPVFAYREQLIEFLMSDRYYGFGTSPTPLTREQAEAFVGLGWSIGSMVTSGGRAIAGDAAVHEMKSETP